MLVPVVRTLIGGLLLVAGLHVAGSLLVSGPPFVG